MVDVKKWQFSRGWAPEMCGRSRFLGRACGVVWEEARSKDEGSCGTYFKMKEIEVWQFCLYGTRVPNITVHKKNSLHPKISVST